MAKRNKIIYWVSTIWLALGMVSSGIVPLFKMEEESEVMKHVGFPMYFLAVIGV